MQVVNSSESTEVEYVRRKLIEYNAINTPSEVPQRYEEVNILLKDDCGNILGGMLAIVMWNFMHVDIIWIDEAVRGKGYGSQLLRLAEENALVRGCVCVQLDTFNFQAPDFYNKHGYGTVGAVSYTSDKFARYYMVKWLKPE